MPGNLRSGAESRIIDPEVPSHQHDVVWPLDADATRLLGHNEARQSAAHRNRDNERQRGKLAHVHLGAQKD